MGLWGLPPKISIAVRHGLISLNREVSVEVDVYKDGNVCVSVAGDDSTAMAAFSLVLGGYGWVSQHLRVDGKVPDTDFLLSSSVFFCKFLMSNGFFSFICRFFKTHFP